MRPVLVSALLTAALVVPVVTVPASVVDAAQGDLVASFGVDGIAPIDTGYGIITPAEVRQVIVQPDGRTVVLEAIEQHRWALMRFTTTGAPDPSWNQGVPVGLTHLGDVGRVTLLSDGSVIRTVNAGIQKFTADGSPDTSFGQASHLQLFYGFANFEIQTAIATGGGSAVVAGKVYWNLAWRPFAARINANGTLDASFGTDGFWFGPDGLPWRVNGIVHLGGELVLEVGDQFGSALVRLDSAGQLVPQFGAAGQVSLPAGGCVVNDANGTVLLLDPVLQTMPSAHVRLSRYSSTGALDGAFGVGGVAAIAWPATSGGFACTDISVVGDVAYVKHRVGTLTYTPYVTAIDLAAGSLSAGFGTAGHVTLATVSYPTYSGPLAIGANADGPTAAVGTGPDLTDSIVLHRWDTNGANDASFGTDGSLPLVLRRHRSIGTVTTAVDPDGSILVLTQYDPAVAGGTSVARFDTDGNGLGPGGSPVIASVPRSGDLAVLPDGRFVVNFADQDGNHLAMFQHDGTPDTSFGTAGIAPVPYRLVRAGGTPADPQLFVGDTVSQPLNGRTLRITRIDPQSGAGDSQFGAAGTATIGPATNSTIVDFRVLVNGGIAWAIGATQGTPTFEAQAFARIGRLSANGSPDATFGQAGSRLVTTPFFDRSEGWVRLYPQQDGSLVVAGAATGNVAPHTSPDAVVLRVTPTGALDPSFGTDGITSLTDPWWVSDAAVDSNGVTFVGRAANGQVMVRRLDASGHADESFGPGGVQGTDLLDINGLTPLRAVAVSGGVIVALTVASAAALNEIPGANPALGKVSLDGPTFAAKPVMVLPARVLDTRSTGTTMDHLSERQGLRPAGTTTQVQISGRAQVRFGAAAVIVNLTVANAQANGYLTAYPCDAPLPLASSLNYVAGQVVANEVIVRLPTLATPLGSLCIYNSSATNIIADVVGSLPGGSAYDALTPARLVDTRNKANTIDGLGPEGKLPAGSVTEIDIAGRGGVAPGAPAAVLNITAVKPSNKGYFTVFPCGVAQPGSSSLNFVASQSQANEVIATLPTSGLPAGKVCVYTSEVTDLVIDVVGAYPISSAYLPLTPARYLDTRSAPNTTFDDGNANEGIAAAGSVYELQVAGRGDVPLGASAVVLNITLTGGTAGWVTVHSCGYSTPNASTLNIAKGRAIANETVVSLPTTGPKAGKVCLYTSAPTHLIVDVAGAFT